MPVSDDQLELLEAYVDGELAQTQAVALQTRLHADSELTSALHAIREQRRVRLQLFESLEPDDRTAGLFFKEIQKEITKDIIWGERLRIVRYIGAAAACVVFSFFAGWVGRSYLNSAPPMPTAGEQPTVVQASDFKPAPSPSRNGFFTQPFSPQFSSSLPAEPVQQVSQETSQQFSPRDMQLTLAPTHPAVPAFDNSGIGMPPVLSNLSPRAGTPNLTGTRRPGGYQVALTDPTGRVVAVQHFETLEEARDFQQDVSRWQNHIQNADAVIVKDRF